MSTHHTIHDMLELVLQRLAFLECLDEGRKDKRTLNEELDCSRSIVDRGIRELEALDLVEYTTGGYQITPLGGTVATGIRELAETVERFYVNNWREETSCPDCQNEFNPRRENSDRDKRSKSLSGVPSSLDPYTPLEEARQKYDDGFGYSLEPALSAGSQVITAVDEVKEAVVETGQVDPDPTGAFGHV